MRKDTKTIKNSKDIIVKADKTRNLYQVPKEQYSKLMKENITKNYKIAPENAYDEVNSEAKEIAEDLDLQNRMDVLAKSEAFITLKDHKNNFARALPCRLINPAKSEVGVVSKAILEKIVAAVRRQTAVNLWRSTMSVIEWFKEIPDKQRHTFLCFDVVEFYPSIGEQLLRQALSFAEQFTTIEPREMDIIFHARKSLLFHDGRPWMKDKGDMFDVTMGSYDGAETCELVGAFLLNQLSSLVDRSAIGLYRDDGLAALKDTSPQAADRLRKKLTEIFKRFDLKITIEANLKVVDFLDVTMNLDTGKFQPFRKPNDNPLYVSKQSNHPPGITNNIPPAVNKRLSAISSDAEAFNHAAPVYQTALKASGYTEVLSFQPEAHEHMGRKNRSRKIIWFNPPYSKNVSTNVAGRFLSLVSRHFPKTSKLGKIFNRNTLKVSYSCMPNMGAVISSHNKSNLREPEQTKACNCRIKESCPLRGECQTKEIVYEATAESTSKIYIGLSETPFKARHANHLTSMRHEKYKNSTELAKHVWELKSEGKPLTITWKVREKSRSYRCESKKCNLCTAEKFHILTTPKKLLLNKRSEMVSKCRHENKFRLANFTPIKLTDQVLYCTLPEHPLSDYY